MTSRAPHITDHRNSAGYIGRLPGATDSQDGYGISPAELRPGCSAVGGYMTPSFLIQLMSRKPIPMAWGRRRVELEPEQRESVEFADDMRAMTLTGEYKGIWLHIPNEGKRSLLVALILRAMGLITGAPDYIFIWAGGCLLAELKIGKNKQSQGQSWFQQWVEYCGLRYELCYSKEEIVAALKDEMSRCRIPHDYAELTKRAVP